MFMWGFSVFQICKGAATVATLGLDAQFSGSKPLQEYLPAGEAPPSFIP